MIFAKNLFSNDNFSFFHMSRFGLRTVGPNGGNENVILSMQLPILGKPLVLGHNLMASCNNLTNPSTQVFQKCNPKSINMSLFKHQCNVISGYPTYNNWVGTKVPSAPSLAKGFSAWSLNSPLAASAMAHHHNQVTSWRL
jgi:hypothetical protein